MEDSVFIALELLTPISLLLGLYLGAMWLITSLKNSKRNARDEKLRYTASFLREECELVFPREAVAKLSPEEMFSEDFLGVEKQAHRKELIHYMNSMELLSYLIGNGVLDEELVKGFRCTALVKAFFESQVFIMHLRYRNNAASAYADWEFLARKWSEGLRGVEHD